MILEDAKKLRWGDKIRITMPGLYGSTMTWQGKFESLTHFGKQYYIHYRPREMSPPGQKVKIEFVERSEWH